MIPIVTPAEMAAIDAAAPVPVAALVERAGAAVARTAVHLLGGTYGRRVAIIAGKGNNGADGRAAATRLQRRGVRCVVLDPDIAALPVEVDLVIDAAYGTGLSRPYKRDSFWAVTVEKSSTKKTEIDIFFILNDVYTSNIAIFFDLD